MEAKEENSVEVRRGGGGGEGEGERERECQ